MADWTTQAADAMSYRNLMADLAALCERPVAAFMGTAQAEWDEAAVLGIPLRGTVIPLGVEVPHPGNRQILIRDFPELEGRGVFLFLSRLDPKKNVWEEISDGNDQLLLGKREVNSRGYCSAFNFKGADQQKKVGALSGGERNRVHLAKMLKSGANVLLLDEPTNDLDVDTLRALEEALEDFAGCAVIISHDRWFLDRIATHILAFEDDSHVEWFEGNFQDYEKDKMRRLGQDSIIPHRVKYKKLTR